ncbi:MAG: aminoglycoside phosphotransferase family protein [Candidatus Moduliflexus flocculans]|nr:aminoglycoside phosphotransferase family protein [Candidatus Moduliflexus flocculans]
MPELDRICAAFDCPGTWVSSCPIPSGHINDTYCSEFDEAGRRGQVRQPADQPPRLPRARTAHGEHRAGDALRPRADRGRRGRSRARDPHHRPDARREVLPPDPGGHLLADVPLHRRRPDLRQGRGPPARLFGLEGLRQLPEDAGPPAGRAAPRDHPGFPPHPEALRRLPGRARTRSERPRRRRRPEIDFVLAREKDTGVVVDGLASGLIPERVTHNDTKLNNVMIDNRTGEGVCVIDLDTVMPGSVLYDFGDSVRLGAATAVEDERDLDKVGFDLGMFDRLAAGYLDAARDFLVPAETERLAFSAKLLTLECGIRFLTDHLKGDVYFKIHRAGHNLDRARTQFKMVAEMERRMDEMDAVVRKYL